MGISSPVKPDKSPAVLMPILPSIFSYVLRLHAANAAQSSKSPAPTPTSLLLLLLTASQACNIIFPLRLFFSIHLYRSMITPVPVKKSTARRIRASGRDLN